MKENKSKPQNYMLRQIFWSIIVVIAFIKSIEGQNHISKRKYHKKKRHGHNKIICICK